MNARTFRISNGCLVAVSALCLLAVSAGAMAPPPYQPGGGRDRSQVLSPHPATWDQITHNVGNIVTTVDNWGYIGGYNYYGYPSGEWPRNSGHDYLAEVRFWMGGIAPNGDTLVSNSADDFQCLPNDELADPYRILLSTDTTRYFGYDPTDTVGLGEGKPAYGWRVWNPSVEQWDYNEVYNALATEYRPGGPTSLQDSHVRFTDNATGQTNMGLEITQTIYQWNYCYNEDFMFVVLDITNASEIDYADFAVGMYIDIDVGGPDGTGENGRLGDLVGFDSTENLAWIYDEDYYDEGWKARAGIMGTKLLETPDNIGMTAFRTDDWAFLPDNDPGRYAMINSEQFDASLPPTDQFYVQCTRGIDLTAGKTVRVVFALVAGMNDAEFRDNAALAQELYDNNFVGPEPPSTPVLTAKAGSEKVYLSWGDTSEVSLDPMSGEADFVGYKLYRSTDRGRTWGEELDGRDIESDCLDIDYETIAEYKVNEAGDPIARSFVDSGLVNGVEYWYCLVAYDRGDTTVGVDPLQSGFGTAGEVPNVLSVVPQAHPAGYYDAQSTLEHQYTGVDVPSEGNVYAEIFNPDNILGDSYTVVFEDGTTSTVWHLLNETTGDTVLADQTLMDASPQEYPVVEGWRVMVTDGVLASRGLVQTGFSGADTTLAWSGVVQQSIPWAFDNPAYVWSHEPFRCTYELRYTGDSTRSCWILDGYYEIDNVYQVPFEIWNTTRNERVSLAVHDLESDGEWQPYDPLVIVDYPYDSLASVAAESFPFRYSWMFQFDSEVFGPATGDIFTVFGAPVNGPGDRFTFKVDGVDATAAAGDLKNIKAVPNPYFVRNGNAGRVGELQFKNLPDKCTIRIYTMAGDLVETLDHVGSGEAYWNLLSSNNQQVASGIYIFHVESDYGEFLGRFAVVK